MELRARLFPLGRGSSAVLSDVLPAEKLVARSARYPVAVDDPALVRILTAGDAADGFWVAGEAVLSAREAREATHFELVTRLVVRETERDFAANDAARACAPWIHAGGEDPIRLLAGLTLSRIRLRPNQVGVVGEWTAEYVVGAAVVEALRRAELAGFSLQPITNGKTGLPHEEYRQLFCDALLGPARIDASVERLRSRVAEEDGRLRHLGCLAYDRTVLADGPDVRRTAEPWASWHGWPSWVVSARFAEVFRRSGLRGWHFRPVLVADSELHSRYLSSWTRLRELVAATSKSSMDGGRW